MIWIKRNIQKENPAKTICSTIIVILRTIATAAFLIVLTGNDLFPATTLLGGASKILKQTTLRQMLNQVSLQIESQRIYSTPAITNTLSVSAPVIRSIKTGSLSGPMSGLTIANRKQKNLQKLMIGPTAGTDMRRWRG